MKRFKILLLVALLFTLNHYGQRPVLASDTADKVFFYLADTTILFAIVSAISTCSVNTSIVFDNSDLREFRLSQKGNNTFCPNSERMAPGVQRKILNVTLTPSSILRGRLLLF